jgi:phosphopantetheinyl transferase
MDWRIDATLGQADAGGLRLSDGGLLVVLAPRGLADRLPLSTLSAEERDRHDRFRLPADRARFLVAHALKRQVLGGLLGRPGASLRFAPLEHGKPVLVDAGLHFNLSHSGDRVALAVAAHAPVGIDVEQITREPAGLPADYVFHPGDVIAGAGPETADRFLAAWTLKEAMAKSAGLGLGLDFRTLRLESLPDGCHRGVHPLGPWLGRWGRLDARTHMAIAAARPWRTERLVGINAD